MALKFIFGLVLAIAVGVLGGSDLGNGIFGFKTTASAQNTLESVRDMTEAMQIYRAADDQNRSAFTTAGVTSTVVGVPTTAEVLAELGDLLKPNVVNTFGDLEVEIVGLTAGGGDGVYLTVSNLTHAMCDEMNDILRHPEGTVIPELVDINDILTVVPDAGELQVNGLLNGESMDGVCARGANSLIDLNGGATSTLYYYVSAQ